MKGAGGGRECATSWAPVYFSGIAHEGSPANGGPHHCAMAIVVPVPSLARGARD